MQRPREPDQKAEIVDKAEEDSDVFNFDEYAEKNHLSNLKEFGSFANEHHLKMKNMPIKVQL